MLPPSSFPRDPEGYLGNQAGHFLIGFWLAYALLPLWGYPTPLIVGLGYWLVWELGVQRGRLWRDSIEDAIHVTTGATALCAAMQGWAVWPVMSAQGLLLGVGAWRRS